MILRGAPVKKTPCITTSLNRSQLFSRYRYFSTGIKTSVEIKKNLFSRYYNWGSDYHGQSCSGPPAPLGYIPMVKIAVVVVKMLRVMVMVMISMVAKMGSEHHHITLIMRVIVRVMVMFIDDHGGEDDESELVGVALQPW